MLIYKEILGSMSMNPVKLYLRNLQHLPLASDGITLLSFPSVTAKVENPSASRFYKVTVVLDKPNGFLVTLYEADITSKKVPLEVAAVVKDFNANIEKNWDVLLHNYAQEQSKAALKRLRAASADVEKWSHLTAKTRKGYLNKVTRANCLP